MKRACVGYLHKGVDQIQCRKFLVQSQNIYTKKNNNNWCGTKE